MNEYIFDKELIKDYAEDIILAMADIVHENRRLRYENKQLLEEQKQHRETINNLVDTSFNNTAKVLEALCANSNIKESEDE